MTTRITRKSTLALHYGAACTLLLASLAAGCGRAKSSKTESARTAPAGSDGTDSNADVSVSLAPSTADLLPGNTVTFTAQIVGDAAGGSTAVPAFTSSAPSVLANQGNGVFLAKTAGTATVTVTAGTATATAKVTVTAAGSLAQGAPGSVTSCPSFAAFAANPAPIMNASCVSCHSSGGPGAGAFPMGFGTGSGACAALVPTWLAAKKEINDSSPANSNFLLKPQGQLSHGGGKVLSVDQVTIFNSWVLLDDACQAAGEGGSRFSVAQLCSPSGTPLTPPTGGDLSPSSPAPVLPVPASVYVAKVKNLLLGLPPTDAEVSAVSKDPAQLAALVTSWQALPQYQDKMLTFFANAFQQKQAQADDFANQGVRIDSSTTAGAGTYSAYILANLRESFARTALAVTQAGQPFTSLMATNTFMMTPPLMAYYAQLDSKLIPDNGSNASSLPAVTALTGFNVPADFTNWRSVTITQQQSGTVTTSYTDQAALQTASTLTLNVPRAGFYTTPAFFAQWQTNASNQARVTMNQAWIVGVGAAFDGSDTTTPKSLAALDSNHSAPGSQCYGCHVQLDPMRQYFRQAYSLSFHQQTAAAQSSLPGQFVFEGVSSVGKGIADLGSQMAAVPGFAAAWTQKLCTYANSAPCLTTDPEFLRLAQLFVSSNYSWNTLVSAVFSSPIVTYAQSTPTEVANGGAATIARRTHLCANLSNRLGIADICGLNPTTVVTGSLRSVKTIALGLSDDSYSRGSPAPVLVSNPDLFFYGGMRNICTNIANVVIDAGSSSKYVSTNVNDAIADFTSNLMGLDSSRSAAVLAVLKAHNAAALQSGLSATNALKSTFVLACTSPNVALIGE